MLDPSEEVQCAKRDNPPQRTVAERSVGAGRDTNLQVYLQKTNVSERQHPLLSFTARKRK